MIPLLTRVDRVSSLNNEFGRNFFDHLEFKFLDGTISGFLITNLRAWIKKFSKKVRLVRVRGTKAKDRFCFFLFFLVMSTPTPPISLADRTKKQNLTFAYVPLTRTNRTFSKTFFIQALKLVIRKLELNLEFN